MIKSKRIIIEVDGGQHFREVWKHTTPEEQRTNDCFKMYRAIRNGYSIIRICQEDIWKNTFGWKKQLQKTITKADSSENLEIYYLSKDKSLYDKHKYHIKVLLDAFRLVCLLDDGMNNKK